MRGPIQGTTLSRFLDIIVAWADQGDLCRIRNKAKLKAFELVDPRNTELRKTLQKAEFAMMAGDDVVDDEDEGPTGSASDSE